MESNTYRCDGAGAAAGPVTVLATFRRGGGDFRLDRANAVFDANLQVTVAVLQVALCPPFFQHDLAGGPEDLVVHCDHDGQWYVERP